MVRVLVGLSPLILIVLVLLAPTPVQRGYIRKFDTAPLERLEREQPRVVMFGNSMLFTRIHEKRLAQLSGDLRISTLAEPSAFSACWYLWLENYICRMRNPPRTVVIFFRDDQLTQPTYRTTGQYTTFVHSFMLGNEPVVRKVAGVGTPRPTWHRGPLLQWLYPVLLDRLDTRNQIYNVCLDVAAGTGTKDRIKTEIAEQFEISDLRDDIGDDIRGEDDDEFFEFDVETSFLPHIIELARGHGIELILYRVKRRPNAQGLRSQSQSLRAYMDQLRAYLEREQVLLVDETADQSLGLNLYADGDHLEKAAMPAYTETWWRRMEPYLNPHGPGPQP